MSDDSHNATPPHVDMAKIPKSRGYWASVWVEFRQRRFAMLALMFVVVLALIAVFSPTIAGTKPVICEYKGNIYFPCMGYFYREWENPIFHEDKFRKRYPNPLKEKDPNSWAVWPLVYQDPSRRVREDEFPGIPGNETGEDGKPYLYYLWLQGWDRFFETDSTREYFGEEAPAFTLFGTDSVGRDVFAKMVHGTRIALLVGFVATGIAAAIGVTLGATAGYFGGWIDMSISRLIELTLCIPSLVLILALLAVVEKPTIWHVMIVLGIARWPSIARLMRAEFLRLKQSDYVIAARSLGASEARVMFRHILPNSLAPIMVPIVFGIASAILIEAGLSLLGFGTSSDSWGNILASGRENYEMWWTIVFPGLAIFFTVLAFNLIGEGVQEATDPRLREGAK